MTAGGHRHWAEIGESTSARGIRFLYGVHRWLGRWPFRLCMSPVLLVHWATNRTARQASLQYLQRLHAHGGVFAREPGWRESLRHFGLFAETMLDKLLALGGRYPIERVRIRRQAMLAQIASGQGGVIVTAHTGCLELCQVLADLVPGFRVTALVHTAHAERFNRLSGRLRPQGGVRLMQVAELDAGTAMLLGERVAKGEFVAIAGDRVPVRGGGRTVQAVFLGHDAPFPVGPYVLAAALECPLFTMSCLHAGDGYAMDFERFADRIVLPRASRHATLAQLAARFAQTLEAQVCRSPYDWFNFFPFWDQNAPQQDTQRSE